MEEKKRKGMWQRKKKGNKEKIFFNDGSEEKI